MNYLEPFTLNFLFLFIGRNSGGCQLGRALPESGQTVSGGHMNRILLVSRHRLQTV